MNLHSPVACPGKVPEGFLAWARGQVRSQKAAPGPSLQPPAPALQFSILRKERVMNQLVGHETGKWFLLSLVLVVGKTEAPKA